MAASALAVWFIAAPWTWAAGAECLNEVSVVPNRRSQILLGEGVGAFLPIGRQFGLVAA